MMMSISHRSNRSLEVALYKLLAHPTRLAILDALRTGEECVCHLEALLGCRQAYLSQQLAALRESGIIADRRDGWNIYYRVISAEIYAVMDSVRSVSQVNAQPPVERQSSPDCPCPKCAGKNGQKTNVFSSETILKEK